MNLINKLPSFCLTFIDIIQKEHEIIKITIDDHNIIQKENSIGNLEYGFYINVYDEKFFISCQVCEDILFSMSPLMKIFGQDPIENEDWLYILAHDTLKRFYNKIYDYMLLIESKTYTKEQELEMNYFFDNYSTQNLLNLQYEH